jgi:hypothetical protein
MPVSPLEVSLIAV